jgi:hypothetical protein
MTKIMLKNIKRLGESLELGIDKKGLYVNGKVAVLGYGLIATKDKDVDKNDIGLSARDIMNKYANTFVYIKESIQYLYT